MTESSRRNVARLSFAGRLAPRLETTDHHSYEVVDLSPEGLRFRLTTQDGNGVTIGDIVHATLRFPADRAVEIEGEVLRVTGNEAAVRLIRGQERLAGTVPMGPASPRRTGLLW